jgi:glycosyltransferase involved in cell wall biosynthesis
MAVNKLCGRKHDPGKAENMRILQILISPDPGGVSALATIVERGLRNEGVEVETRFLVASPNGDFGQRLSGAMKAAWRIAVGGHDAVIAYQPSTSILVGLSGFFFGKRRRIVHQTTVPSANRRIIRVLDRLLGSLGLYPINVVNTAYTASLYDDYSKRYRRSLVLIEHGISVPSTAGPRNDVLAKHGIPKDKAIILNTGRLCAQKDQEILLRALRDLPGARLVIAGEGELREPLEALAAELGVQDRAHLIGAIPREECLALYMECDIFAFPSRHETFGISAVEAVMLGVPTVVSDISVLREVLSIDNESVARFVPDGDLDGWRNALADVANAPADDEERRRFAERLAEKYSEKRMISRYRDLLRKF